MDTFFEDQSKRKSLPRHKSKPAEGPPLTFVVSTDIPQNVNTSLEKKNKKIKKTRPDSATDDETKMVFEVTGPIPSKHPEPPSLEYGTGSKKKVKTRPESATDDETKMVFEVTGPIPSKHPEPPSLEYGTGSKKKVKTRPESATDDETKIVFEVTGPIPSKHPEPPSLEYGTGSKKKVKIPTEPQTLTYIVEDEHTYITPNLDNRIDIDVQPSPVSSIDTSPRVYPDRIQNDSTTPSQTKTFIVSYDQPLTKPKKSSKDKTKQKRPSGTEDLGTDLDPEANSKTYIINYDTPFSHKKRNISDYTGPEISKVKKVKNADVSDETDAITFVVNYEGSVKEPKSLDVRKPTKEHKKNIDRDREDLEPERKETLKKKVIAEMPKSDETVTFIVNYDKSIEDEPELSDVKRPPIIDYKTRPDENIMFVSDYDIKPVKPKLTKKTRHGSADKSKDESEFSSVRTPPNIDDKNRPDENVTFVVDYDIRPDEPKSKKARHGSADKSKDKSKFSSFERPPIIDDKNRPDENITFVVDYDIKPDESKSKKARHGSADKSKDESKFSSFERPTIIEHQNRPDENITFVVDYDIKPDESKSKKARHGSADKSKDESEFSIVRTPPIIDDKNRPDENLTFVVDYDIKPDEPRISKKIRPASEEETTKPDETMTYVINAPDPTVRIPESIHSGVRHDEPSHIQAENVQINVKVKPVPKVRLSDIDLVDASVEPHPRTDDTLTFKVDYDKPSIDSSLPSKKKDKKEVVAVDPRFVNETPSDVIHTFVVNYDDPRMDTSGKKPKQRISTELVQGNEDSPAPVTFVVKHDEPVEIVTTGIKENVGPILPPPGHRKNRKGPVKVRQ